MTLQSSGAISLANLATEFGDSAPHSISEFYRGGAKVSSNNSSVPASGAIGLGNFYGAVAALVLDITANTSNVNILTLATAAGYNAATDSTPIIVNVAAGVVVSGSGTYAMRTGALNANSDLTVNVAGQINGYTGSSGSTTSTAGATGGSGGAGGDAIYWETSTGGSGAYAVTVAAGGYLRGGGGGSGGGGGPGRVDSYDGGSGSCVFDGNSLGSSGSAGSTGGYGQSGTSGSSGTDAANASDPTSASNCRYASPGSGGSGGAAGYALRKNSRTVTLTNSGTVAGSTA